MAMNYMPVNIATKSMSIFFRVEHRDGQYEPQYKCKCKHTLLRLKIEDNPSIQNITDLKGNTVELKCPKCAEGKLVIKEHILWD